MPNQPIITVEQRENFLLVRVNSARIDEGNIGALRSQVAEAGAGTPHMPVAVDMERVEYMPSLSLGGLIQLSQLFKGRRQRLTFCRLQEAVRETLVLTRLDRVLELSAELPGGAPSA